MAKTFPCSGPNVPYWITQARDVGNKAYERGLSDQEVYNKMKNEVAVFNVPEQSLITYILECDEFPSIAARMRETMQAHAQAQYQAQYAQAAPDVKQQMDKQAFTKWWQSLLTQVITTASRSDSMNAIGRAVQQNNLHERGVSDDEISAYLINAHRNIMEEIMTTGGVERQALFLNTKYDTYVVPPRNPPYPLAPDVRQAAIAEANASRAAAGKPPSTGPPAGGNRRYKKTKKQTMKKRKSKSKRNNKKTRRH